MVPLQGSGVSLYVTVNKLFIQYAGAQLIIQNLGHTHRANDKRIGYMVAMLRMTAIITGSTLAVDHTHQSEAETVQLSSITTEATKAWSASMVSKIKLSKARTSSALTCAALTNRIRSEK
jgi:hypothetical protein